MKLSILLSLLCMVLATRAENDEARLVKTLFQGPNDPNLRPITNSSAAIQVTFGATLLSFDLEEMKNNPTLTSLIWLNFQFKNEYLKWDPAEFGNVQDLRLPANLLWVPDIFLYNDATGEFHKYLQEGHRPTNAVISNTGTVTWIPPVKASVACRFDDVASNYLCSLKFGSWVFSSLGIDLQLNNKDGLDLSSLVVNDKWELVKSEGKRNSIKYECCPEEYLDITFDLVIKKKQGAGWLSGLGA